MMTDPVPAEENAPPRPFWAELAYRWFVLYNPLYLFSAAFVLVGVVLVSKGLARQDGMLAELWLTAVTELYQAMLIVAAALLYRRGQPRPALMLALLEVVYLADLTFQTGVAPYYHQGIGLPISLAWLVLTVLKLAALAWSLQLRLSLSALLLPGAGAIGVAVLPHLLHGAVLGEGSAERLIAGWLFGLAAAGLWWRPRVESKTKLGGRGETVLHRAVRASYIIWLSLLLGHVIWWSIDYHLQPGVGLICGAILLGTHFVRGEARVWTVVGLALTVAFIVDPGWLSTTALMGAAVLGLRAWRRRSSPTLQSAALRPIDQHPYRRPSNPSAARPARPATLLVAPPPDEARRFVAAALASLYLGLWTAGWSGGLLPEHRLWLDLALAALMVALAWRRGRALPSLILAVVLGHLGVERGLVTAPGSSLGWGALALAVGFGLLVVGFAVNWFAPRRAAP